MHLNDNSQSFKCVLIRARSYNSAGTWHCFCGRRTQIFYKILQQQSFSTNRWQQTLEFVMNAEDVTGMTLFSCAGISRLLPAASFDSSTPSSVPGKVENDAKASLPDHTTWNKVLIWVCFFCFFLNPASHSWGFVCCEKRLWKAKWFVFLHDWKHRTGWAVPRVFSYGGSMSHF